jgi:hypothetical protein
VRRVQRTQLNIIRALYSTTYKLDERGESADLFRLQVRRRVAGREDGDAVNRLVDVAVVCVNV